MCHGTRYFTEPVIYGWIIIDCKIFVIPLEFAFIHSLTHTPLKLFIWYPGLSETLIYLLVAFLKWVLMNPHWVFFYFTKNYCQYTLANTQPSVVRLF